MSLIHPHTALLSQREALLPPENLIDGRTAQDHLSFMVGFAKLVNFYDSQNVQNGNWEPFLLKDPAILLAVIAATNYENRHRLFVKTINKVNAIFKVIGKEISAFDDHKFSLEDNLTLAVTGLFDQLMNLFLDLNTWAISLDRSDNKFELKTYVFEQLKSQTGACCYALIALRQALVIQKVFKGLSPYAPSTIKNLEAKYWTSTLSQEPFWKILDFDKKYEKLFDKKYDEALKQIPLKDLVLAIENAGDAVFIKLKKIIEAAKSEYEIESVKKSKYPDTTLVRTFAQLLKNQQQEINNLTAKHLDFYYNDILKQENVKATADSVYANITLVEDAPNLVKVAPNTLFSAGQDKEDLPIEFALDSQTYLNTAKISKAITLLKESNSEHKDTLFLKQIDAPTQIVKDEEEQIESWTTFGADNNTTGTKQSMSLIFASPILYLTNGKRTIHVTMGCPDHLDYCKQFDNAKYYLSTQAEWLNVTLCKDYPKVTTKDSSSSIEFKFVLEADQPEIVAFSEEAQQISSSWPLIKFEFDEFLNLKKPPKISSVSFSAEVENFKNVLIYNDNGSLGEEVPFQLYGPIANQGANFMLGSTEIFSKPIEWLRLGYVWDSLPKQFDSYYQQYNFYLQDQHDCLKDKSTSGFKKLVSKISSLVLVNKQEESTTRKLARPFNNLYFQVDFNCLSKGSWLPVPLEKESYDSKEKYIKYQTDKSCELSKSTNEEETDNPTDPLWLFSTNGNKCETIDNSFFAYYRADLPEEKKIKANVELQNQALEFNASTLSGFLRMTLTNPIDSKCPVGPFGFGNDIYAQVVSFITLHNAKILSDDTLEDDTKVLPNPPFIPTVNDFMVSYECKATHSFVNTADNDYPIEVFYQTPFATFKTYSLGDTIPERAPDLAQEVVLSKKSEGNSLSLYPSFNSRAALYLGMEKLMAPAPLDLYFEMISSQNQENSFTNKGARIKYNSLGKKGWNKADILKDSTRDLLCSGLLSLDIPKSALRRHHSMPNKFSWLSLTIDSKPETMANTVYVNTNGIKLTRTGTSWMQRTFKPEIAANTITGPVNLIESYESILQPFDSFGGRAATSNTELNDFVSLRIRTKDRLVNSADYYDSITNYFDRIFYVKTKSNKHSGNTQLLLVKEVNSVAVPGAFLPTVDPCLVAEIEDFVNKNASPFAQIKASNFNLEYLRLRISITVKNSYDFEAISQSVSRKLRLYLSPWIKTQEQQLTIDTGISGALISQFVSSLDGVTGVTKIEYATNTQADNFKPKRTKYKTLTSLIDSGSDRLFVSSKWHKIINANSQ